ncbi:MAG: phytoene/squalene synthase family protein [Azospirillaceae bacterium]
MSVEDKLSACGRLARRYDPDRYLAALFAPPERREALFALAAFNIEIAKTREAVSEPMLGQIRLQWWRETLNGVFGAPADGEGSAGAEGGQGARAPRRHEVVEPLSAAAARYGLDRAPLDSLIDARERDLEIDERPFATLDELEAYARETGAPLVVAGLRVLGADTPEAREAGEAVGTAFALTGIARAVPFQARFRRTALPEDLIAETGVDRGDLFELRSSPALAAAIERLAARARDHLARARRLRGGIPRAAVPGLLTARLAEGHLTRLAAAGHDPFDGRVGQAPPWRAYGLSLAAFLGRY